MRLTFADSFYLLALFNRQDSAHERALEASRLLQGMLLTTDWVLTEVADALSAPANRVACGNFLDDLRRSPAVIVERSSAELFEAGWSLYGERPDKEWSLTDCISFVVMEKHGVVDALTGDHHFEQAGFRAVLR